MFEEFIINARTDRYNLMCFIDAHEKDHTSSFDDGSSGGGNFFTIKFNNRIISFTHCDH